MVELKNVKVARLWMLPPVAMEVAIELLWRDLGKSTDILFTVPVGFPFWGTSQFEPLIVAIIFPPSHVTSYTGP